MISQFSKVDEYLGNSISKPWRNPEISNILLLSDIAVPELVGRVHSKQPKASGERRPARSGDIAQVGTGADLYWERRSPLSFMECGTPEASSKI